MAKSPRALTATPRPLWTPPLFGWQYPIEWNGDHAQAIDLPKGADIWLYRGQTWVATLRWSHRERDPFNESKVELRLRGTLSQVTARLESQMLDLALLLRVFGP